MCTLLTNELDGLDWVEVFGSHQASGHDGRRPGDASLAVNENTALPRFRRLVAIFDHGGSLVQSRLNPVDCIGKVRQDICVGSVVNFECVNVELRGKGQAWAEERDDVCLLGQLSARPACQGLTMPLASRPAVSMAATRSPIHKPS